MAETMLKKHVPIEKKVDNVTENGASSKPVSTSQQENKEPHKKTEKMSVKSANTSKTVTTGAAGSRGTNDINNEIGLILKELNSNVLQQGEQIKKLSDRVDFLYDDSNYDPYYENYDDEYEGTSCLEHTSPHCDENDSEDCPPSKKAKTTFKGLSDKFLLAEKVDNEVNEDLAQFVNSSFRSGVSDERVAEITKDVYRPNNCDSLTKTRVNPGIWRLLKPQTQTDDAKMQAIQNLMIKASINFVKLLDKNSEDFDSESLEWGTNALALLGQCNKLVNNKRKESHKHDLDPKFYPLTSASLPYTDYLYGDETDVNRNIKDIQDMSRIGKVVRNPRGRGNRGGPYLRGNRGTRHGRARGYYHYRGGDSSVSSTVAKNMREGQKK